MATESSDGFWTEPRFKMAAMGVGTLLFALLLMFSFGYELSLPRKPKKPKAISAERFSQRFDRNPAAWAGYLEMDARTYGVPKPEPSELMGVFKYRLDSDAHFLSLAKGGKKSLEVAGLRLELSKQDIRGRTKKQMVLSIENTTNRPLAYRVITRPSKGTQACSQKKKLRHNAIAVLPGGVERRSECIYRKGWKLKIKRVETLELPLLSYHYVSRLFPAQVGYESRVVAGHRPPRGEECRLILPASTSRGIESGSVAWRDIIDFYARHRCETYTFPINYTHFTKPGEVELPVAGGRR